MLAPEDAKARLAKWLLPLEENRVTLGIAKLSDRLRAIADVLWPYGKDEDADLRKDDWQARNARRQKRVAKATKALESLTNKDRKQLFDIVSPNLTAAFENGWELSKSLPYQRGYTRKAFRVPSSPRLTSGVRFQWLADFGELARWFPPDIITPAWLASWAPYLPIRHPNATGLLLASCLNGKDSDEVFEILRLSLTNQHETGAMGRHVIRALQLSDREDGWELIEKTLLAAQRQEGLRQEILECIDETHPQAFRRMLRLILDHDLVRFAAVIRAVDVWFGNMWQAASAGVVKKMLTQVVGLLEEPATQAKALSGKDPQEAFLALWSQATDDALKSIPVAERLLSHKSVEMRYIAGKHLVNVELPDVIPALAKTFDRKTSVSRC